MRDILLLASLSPSHFDMIHGRWTYKDPTPSYCVRLLQCCPLRSEEKTVSDFSALLKLAKASLMMLYIYIWCRVAGPWDPPPPPRRGKGHVTSKYKTDTLPPHPPVVLWYFQSVVVSKSTAEHVPNTVNTLPPTPPVVLWYFQSVVASKPTAEHVTNTEQIHYPRLPPTPLW